MKLARLEKLKIIQSGDKPKGSAATVVGEVEIYLDLAGLIDIGAEKARLEKDLVEAEKYAKGLQMKLGNEEFVKNAPASVVDGERAKLQEAQTKAEKLKAQLADLG